MPTADPPDTQPSEPGKPSLGQLFAVFLRIGATCFGGVMALLGLLQEHLVERRQAATKEEYAEAVAIGQLLPGPVAVDAAIYLGYRRHGWLGGLAAAVGLILPAFLLMLILTPLYLEYGVVPQAQGFFSGVRPAVVALILAAGWRIGKRAMTAVGSIVVAAVVFVAMLIGANPILLVLLAGALGVLLCPAAQEGRAPSPPAVAAACASRRPIRVSRLLLVVALVVALAGGGLLALHAGGQASGDILRLAVACLRVGTFVFGGGFVLVPLLEGYVVGPAPWLTHQQFLDAVALGQMTPGPLLVTATFVGYKLGRGAGLAVAGLAATVGTVCILLPSFFMTIAASHHLNRIRGNFYVQRIVKGTEAGVVGLVTASAVLLGRISIVSVPQAVLAVAALVVLLRFRVDSGLVVIGAGLLGLGLSLTGLVHPG
jgi:chromate transporter